MRHTRHKVDLCVVGGGIAGICAAIAAARNGAKVALMHDRPVLGGNASSEIRMWICGAHGKDMRETGILEEIELENLHLNPTPTYAMWDAVLYQMVRFEPNITLLLNCSCHAAETEHDALTSVTGWQLTTETTHTVEAALFADCSGDSILAHLAGAEYRIGREASSEFDEDIMPPEADKKTMGMSCLIQGREMDTPQPFVRPEWANYYASEADLLHRGIGMGTNFWWIELGGEYDSIHDSEMLRDMLLKVSYGVWDLLKNRSKHSEAFTNYCLDWVGHLPGKRESRRCVGDHIITQNDVRAEGKFDDLVAYGGWSMDDHHPGGVATTEKPTIFHPAPSPYGIPYRALYSRNIDNLFFAGRNISATHAAMSSTRVMATCALMGQAVGTAAALATTHRCTPRAVYETHLSALQQQLMQDDCYLPWHARAVDDVARAATLSAQSGDPEPLRNGMDRPVAECRNAWSGTPGQWIEYRFDAPTRLTTTRLVFDSDLNRELKNMPCIYKRGQPQRRTPQTLVRSFRIDALSGEGRWRTVVEVEDNHQRLVTLDLDLEASAIRLIPLSTWGAATVNIFAWDVS
ncbi:MAG: FAD-dependent oxidoreductase [Verrucomicrobia bacterium]|jgi:hypothetical protein|nr:FAD-dependent oxidoreductase [Verrucomicrobiota bacterium]MBT7065313.1 FAD-dependent oxidoreductase [Verrucomicrobiota bacterium]MBT7698906.1 FAD-dependent oxidoreductase [Verrucomicrobiota bacterium]